MPSLFGFAPGGVCHAASIARNAVRSYRTFSPLPHPKTRRFVLCGTFPGVAPAGCYPAPYVDGARTFLPGDLSILAGAAVQPTDARGHERYPPRGQAKCGSVDGRFCPLSVDPVNLPPERAFAAVCGPEQKTSCRYAASRNRAGDHRLPAARRHTCAEASSRSPRGIWSNR